MGRWFDLRYDLELELTGLVDGLHVGVGGEGKRNQEVLLDLGFKQIIVPCIRGRSRLREE